MTHMANLRLEAENLRAGWCDRHAALELLELGIDRVGVGCIVGALHHLVMHHNVAEGLHHLELGLELRSRVDDVIRHLAEAEVVRNDGEEPAREL